VSRHLQFDADLDADPDPANHFDPGPNTTFQFDADPCGYGSATLPTWTLRSGRYLSYASKMEGTRIGSSKFGIGIKKNGIILNL
jgi:hypothetical protein